MLKCMKIKERSKHISVCGLAWERELEKKKGIITFFLKKKIKGKEKIGDKSGDSCHQFLLGESEPPKVRAEA